jgi:hypothetical protein
MATDPKWVPRERKRDPSLLPPELMEQEIRACELLGRKVLFAHRPAGVPPALVTTVHWDGMIELECWAGEFAPHLFILAD